MTGEMRLYHTTAPCVADARAPAHSFLWVPFVLDRLPMGFCRVPPGVFGSLKFFANLCMGVYQFRASLEKLQFRITLRNAVHWLETAYYLSCGEKPLRRQQGKASDECQTDEVLGSCAQERKDEAYKEHQSPYAPRRR